MTSAVKLKTPKTGPTMTSAAKPMMNTVAQPVSITNKKLYIHILSEYFEEY